MKKHERMVSRRVNRVGLLLPLGFVSLLPVVVIGCSSASGAGATGDGTHTDDAGAHKSADARVDGASRPVDSSGGAGDAAGGHDSVSDAGTGESAQLDGGSPSTEADAGPPPVCIPHGMACSESTTATPCCTDTCLNSFCGCLPEGAHLADGGAGECCDNLPLTDGGYCGTSACVPDGTPCGDVDGGVVCCNDDCNGTTCGGT